MTSARTKFLIGGALVLGTAGYLMATSIKETGTYYLTPTELATKLDADPGFRNTGVKIGAPMSTVTWPSAARRGVMTPARVSTRISRLSVSCLSRT